MSDPAAGESGAPRFELALICTGNRVRSPIAEGFLRHLLADVPVRLRSVGTMELRGAPPLPEAVEAASVLGLDISTHRARSLQEGDLSDSDLVLGFELRHLAAAVVSGRALRERAFLLAELVGLIDAVGPASDADPVERARRTIARAQMERGNGIPSARSQLVDPLGRDRAFYRSTAERLLDLCERVAIGLFGADAIRPLPRLDPQRGR